MRSAYLLLAAALCGSAIDYAADAKAAYAAIEKLSGHVGFFDADGRYVYTTDNGVLWMTEAGQGGNTVSIVDTRSQTLSGTIDLGGYRRPHGIDVDPKTGNRRGNPTPHRTRSAPARRRQRVT